MSMSNNKLDFETALNILKEYTEDLANVLDEAIMTSITNVIDEYEEHYQSDIEDLIDEAGELKDKLGERV